MTERLETVLQKISSISNTANSSLIQEFYQFMVDNRKSDSYKKNNPKVLILFSHGLGDGNLLMDSNGPRLEEIASALGRGRREYDDSDSELLSGSNKSPRRSEGHVKKQNKKGQKSQSQEEEEQQQPTFRKQVGLAATMRLLKHLSEAKDALNTRQVLKEMTYWQHGERVIQRAEKLGLVRRWQDTGAPGQPEYQELTDKGRHSLEMFQATFSAEEE